MCSPPKNRSAELTQGPLQFIHHSEIVPKKKTAPKASTDKQFDNEKVHILSSSVLSSLWLQQFTLQSYISFLLSTVPFSLTLYRSLRRPSLLYSSLDMYVIIIFSYLSLRMHCTVYGFVRISSTTFYLCHSLSTISFDLRFVKEFYFFVKFSLLVRNTIEDLLDSSFFGRHMLNTLRCFFTILSNAGSKKI